MAAMWAPLVVRLLLLVAAWCANGAPQDEDIKEHVGKYRGSTHVEVLNGDSFVEKVRNVVNDTDDKPDYFPLVMFHMPWCQHCRATLPELDTAAANLHKAKKEGSFRMHSNAPKFFTLQCDEPDVKAICEEHAGTTFPSIILFRDERAVRFNRPRTNQVLAWWAHRVSRVAVGQIDSTAQLKSYTEHEIVFIMGMQMGKNKDAFSVWESIALDNLDRYFFLVADSRSEVGRSLGFPSSGVGITVRGPSHMKLTPLPFTGDFSVLEDVEAWVNYNQFAAITPVTPWTFSDLQRSGLIVATLVHGSGPQGTKILKRFEKKVAELRPKKPFLYATINASEEDSGELFSRHFQLLQSVVAPVPHFFVWSGTENGGLRYWEDPTFNVSDLSLEAIEALMANPEALQEDTTISWIKEKRKLYIRFASRSWTSLMTAVMIPSIAVTLCWKCCSAICTSDRDDEEPQAEKVSKVD